MPPQQTNQNMSTPPVGGIGYYNGQPVQSTVLPGSFNLGGNYSAPASNIVTTAGPATSAFNTYSSNLNDMLSGLGNYKLPGSDLNVGNVNDAYTQLLDRISRGEDASTKALIGTINAARSNRQNEMATQYDSYKRGLQLLGIQHNEAQATPELLMGHIQQAENEHQAKLQQLDIETNKALMDAEQAKNKNDLETLKAKMDYVDKLKQEKRDYLKQIAEQLNAAESIAEDIIPGVYDQLNGLSSADKEKYLVAVSQKYGIPLGALTAAMVREQNYREDRSSKRSSSETGSEDESPVGLLQKAIDSDMSPEEAALDVAGYYESIGVQVDNKLLNQWMKAAKSLKKTTTTTPSETITSIEAPKKKRFLRKTDMLGAFSTVPGVNLYSNIINGISSIFD